MATSEHSIRVTAKGEFSQLQRGLKDLQGDLKNVTGTVDKGARKGGFFDETAVHTLDVFNKRFKGTMAEVNREFAAQANEIDRLTDKMETANVIDKIGIQETIKGREKELDVLRKQLIEMEKIHKKRNSEASSYEIKAPGVSPMPSAGRSGSFAASAITSTISKLGGAIGTIGKLALGLAGVGSLISMAQDAYQIAYQRQVGSLDTAQRIRGYSFTGTASDMYRQAALIGRRDNMGYTEQESWALQDAYSSKAGGLKAEQQYALQKFSRGYGLNATEVGSSIAGIEQLGGVTEPKEFADMIATSVSQSGMLPRIMEVMQAHTSLLSSINTTFKDGSSSQILAYQTTLDKLGNENGMTKLTGQQGTNVISGLNGIYQPNNDKWQWTGIAALQNYDKQKYGSMGLYDLQATYEQGIENSDNVPAMVQYLKQASGGNNNNFKRMMQAWLQDGGFNATKDQINELDKVTGGFTAFSKDKLEKVLGTSSSTDGTETKSTAIDSGTKYDNERKAELGQVILNTEANFDAALGDLGDKFLPDIVKLKEGATSILEKIGDNGNTLNYILAGVVAIGAVSAISNVASIFSKFKRAGNATKAATTAEKAAVATAEKAAAKKAAGEIPIGHNIKTGALTAAEQAEITSLSQGSKAFEKQLTQVYKATGDMDAVKYVKSGKATPGDVIDIISKGDNTVAKKLSTHYEKTGSMASTMKQAEKLGLSAEKVAAKTGAASKIKNAVKPVAKAGTLLSGAIEFGTSLYSGDSVGKSASKAGGSMIGLVGGSALGTSIGTALGAAIGGVFGAGVGAVPGAAIGGWIGNMVGGIGGSMAGSWAGDKGYEFINSKTATGKAAAELETFARQGNLSIDGLSTLGLQELETLKSRGLIEFSDMKTSATTNITSMTDSGKQNLLALQQAGLISIGGFQQNGSAKIVALSEEGRAALNALNSNGSISISDFQKTGKLQITSLSKEGAAKLLELQQNGSASFTSMDSTTSTKLEKIRRDTGTSMDNIYNEHKTATSSISSWFNNFWSALKGFLTGETPDLAKTDESLGGAWEARTGSMSVSQNTDVRGNTQSTTAEALNKVLEGGLAGHGQDFMNAGGLYNIDPTFLAAIATHETGRGSVISNNNVAGMMGSNGLMSFDSIKDGVYAAAKNLDKLYIKDGLITPAEIQKRYAPVGAENDPTALNKNWTNGVTSYWQQFVKASAGEGDSSVGSSIGGTVFEGWQNKINSEFGENRGSRNHGGLDLAAAQGTVLGALKSGTISFINVDDGGKYDPDKKANTNAGGNEVGIKTADGSTYFYSHLSKISDSILSAFKSGQTVTVNAGDFIGKSGGQPGVPGSGSSTTGSHLHLGYMDANGSLINPKQLLNSLNIGDSSVGEYTAASEASTDNNAQIGYAAIDEYLSSIVDLLSSIDSMNSTGSVINNYYTEGPKPTETNNYAEGNTSNETNNYAEGNKTEVFNNSVANNSSETNSYAVEGANTSSSTQIGYAAIDKHLANIVDLLSNLSTGNNIETSNYTEGNKITDSSTYVEANKNSDINNTYTEGAKNTQIYNYIEDTSTSNEASSYTEGTKNNQVYNYMEGNKNTEVYNYTEDNKYNNNDIQLGYMAASRSLLNTAALLISISSAGVVEPVKTTEKDNYPKSTGKLDYIDASGNILSTKDLLNIMTETKEAGETKSAAVTQASISNIANSVHVTVDVNLKGEEVSKLNTMSVAQIKNIVAQAIKDFEYQKLIMNPTVRGY